jgi:hypothetical protein
MPALSFEPLHRILRLKFAGAFVPPEKRYRLSRSDSDALVLLAGEVDRRLVAQEQVRQ